MTDESEKRFHSVMDKLFHVPPTSPSSSSRGRKRPSSALALVEPRPSGDAAAEARPVSSEAPMCRPWDRGDLMRRLATFKSMTWFARPEAVSALNCARRGWINVDIDTIYCEACGARFLFSTPSAWNQQQVEKAAAVFSLKLDKGHKLLCPWIDNVCNDMLSQFPPTPLPILVEKFKERCVALLRLSALPAVSSSAIESMRSPEFDQIIEQPLVLEYENGPADILRTEYLGEEHNMDSVKNYYQAQKLIALCGWEPRTLPYVVDTRHRSSSSLEMENIPNSSNLVASQKDTSVDVQPARVEELTEANGNLENSSRLLCDPNSVVLDCWLCGASVGLWAFVTVPQPMELVRLVGYAEINGETHYSSTENHPHGGREVIIAGSDGATPSKERPQIPQLTIAGGPPPAKQNFKATISFPVIGRNLRARFSGDFKFSDHVVSDQEKVELGTKCDSHGIVNGNHTLLEEIDSTRPGTKDGVSNDQTENLMATEQENFQDNTMLENEGNGGLDDSTAGNSGGSHVIDPSILAIDDSANKIGKDGGTGSSSMVSPRSGDLLQISGKSAVHGEDAMLAGREESPRLPFFLEGDIDIDISDLFGQTTPDDARLNDQNNGEENLQISVNNQLNSLGTEKGKKPVSLDQAMEFHPIRQHRHFCPWISSIYKSAPGWKQTLSALQRQKGFSPSEKSPSTSIIKVDDPITSVRNLFTSPPKRMKRDLLTNRSTHN